MTAAVDRAREAWGADLPDWVLALAAECDGKSQSAVARLVGYSAATVSQVIGGSYRGDLTKVEAAVRGRFMSAVVDCPVDGEIRADRCIAHQRRAMAKGPSPANPRWVRLWRACRGDCPHSRLGGGHGGR